MIFQDSFEHCWIPDHCNTTTTTTTNTNSNKTNNNKTQLQQQQQESIGYYTHIPLGVYLFGGEFMVLLGSVPEKNKEEQQQAVPIPTKSIGLREFGTIKERIEENPGLPSTSTSISISTSTHLDELNLTLHYILHFQLLQDYLTIFFVYCRRK